MVDMKQFWVAAPLPMEYEAGWVNIKPLFDLDEFDADMLGY